MLNLHNNSYITSQDRLRKELEGKITITIGYTGKTDYPFRKQGTYSDQPLKEIQEGSWNEDVVIVYKDPARALEHRNKFLGLDLATEK